MTLVRECNTGLKICVNTDGGRRFPIIDSIVKKFQMAFWNRRKIASIRVQGRGAAMLKPCVRAITCQNIEQHFLVISEDKRQLGRVRDLDQEFQNIAGLRAPINRVPQDDELICWLQFQST